MNLSAEQIEINFLKLVSIIEEKITGSRKEKLLDLYDDWAARIAVAPASTKKQYHNAFPGGYVLHVLNVIEASEKIYDLWESMGANMDFEKEELYFSAINHDLGKIGNDDHDYYVVCKEDWLIKKGTRYVLNPSIPYMKVPERSLMVLGSRGIYVTEKEYLSIKLHDGLYEDSNKAYLISYNEDQGLKTILPHILHQADMISAKVESNTLSMPKQTTKKPPATTQQTKKPVTSSSSINKFLNQ